MAFISLYLIKKIADHHDTHPDDYREFTDADGRVLVTKKGGRVSDLKEVLRLESRIDDVVNTLELPGCIEARLVIGDGSTYVIVCMK